MVGLAFIVLPAAIDQAQKIIAALPPFFEEAKAWASRAPAGRPRTVGHRAHRLGGGPPQAAATTRTRTRSSRSGRRPLEAVASFVTLLVIVFFWLVEHARLQRYTLAFLPMERRAGARDAWNEIETRLGLWVRGQLTLMAAMGIATGTHLHAARAAGRAAPGPDRRHHRGDPDRRPAARRDPGHPGRRHRLARSSRSSSPSIYVVLQFLEGSVLVPMVMRNTIGISPLLVLLSLLIGSAVAGLLGAFLAVPIAASIEIVLARLQARETPVAQDPAAIETPDEEATEDYQDRLPDGAASARAATKP